MKRLIASVILVAGPALASREANATLVGSFGGGAGAFARLPHGFFFGADAGLATLVQETSDSQIALRTQVTPSHHGWAFGVRTGYQWQSGLALEMRFDDLGVHTGTSRDPLMAVTGGVRYALPLFVSPFAEALVGPAFDASGTTFGAALGIGASVIVTRHLGVDLALRDWIAKLDGDVRHIPTVTVGLQLGF